MACDNGHTEVVHWLAERGVEMTVVHLNGDDCFMAAARRGHTEIMSLLIIEGVDTEVELRHQGTARSIASAEGKLAEYEAAFTESSLTGCSEVTIPWKLG